MNTLSLLAVLVLASFLFFPTIRELNVHKFRPHTTEAAVMALSLEDLSRQAELIVQGKVLGKVESITTEFYNNSISVEKVIKGNHAGNTINILTRPSEFTFDNVVLTKGENVILFLNKEKMYGNYMVMFDQGKFNIDPKGVVFGFEIKNMSVPAMEKNIADLLSKPASQVNDTAIRNATEEAIYANDSDTVLNESDTVFNESDFNRSAN